MTYRLEQSTVSDMINNLTLSLRFVFLNNVVQDGTHRLRGVALETYLILVYGQSCTPYIVNFRLMIMEKTDSNWSMSTDWI